MKAKEAKPARMRMLESHLAPYFGHSQPADFGILPLPERRTKDGKLIEQEDPAEEMDKLEKRYIKWRTAARMKALDKEPTKEVVRIFRDQVYLLVRAYSQALNELTAAQAQISAVQSNIPYIRKRSELRNFLLEHHSGYVDQADARNTDLIDVCIAIMSDLKHQTEQQQKTIRDLEKALDRHAHLEKVVPAAGPAKTL